MMPARMSNAEARRHGVLPKKTKREPKPIDTEGCGFSSVGERLVIQLPLPPSINNYRVPCRGRLITSKEGRDWRELALHLLRDCPTFGTNRVRVHVTVYSQKMDLVNCEKALGDALQEAGIIANDSQIDDYHFVRGVLGDAKRRVVVIIKAM